MNDSTNKGLTWVHTALIHELENLCTTRYLCKSERMTLDSMNRNGLQSPSTLRHYFTTRDRFIAAAFTVPGAGTVVTCV